MKLILENWRKFTLSQNQPNKIMISEMFVRGEPEGTNIVAHRENIWKLTDQPSEDIKREIDETLGIETEWDDFFELNQALEEEYRADVLVGQLERSSLSLNLEIDKAGRYRLDPKSSVLVKKVAKELGVRNVSYRYDNEADDEEVVSSYDRKGKVAKIMYHGTCSEYLNKILRLGLVPGRSDTNYEGIIHPDAIFFSSRFEESIYHSFHTAQRAGGDPVVVSLKVPDPALLIPDYDVDMDAGDKSGCFDYICSALRSRQEKDLDIDSFSLSREVGIYGYKGRIPASHLLEYHILANAEESDWDSMNVSQNDFTRATPEEAKIYAFNKEEHGYGSFEEEEPREEEDDEW